MDDTEHSHEDTTSNSSQNSGNLYFESTLSWQEKIHGPADIADYLKNKDSRCHIETENGTILMIAGVVRLINLHLITTNDIYRKGTVAQHETRRHFAQLEKNGQKITTLLTTTMLYTLVDKVRATNDFH